METLRETFLLVLKSDRKFIIFNGHGSDDSIAGLFLGPSGAKAQ